MDTFSAIVGGACFLLAWAWGYMAGRSNAIRRHNFRFLSDGQENN